MRYVPFYPTSLYVLPLNYLSLNLQDSSLVSKVRGDVQKTNDLILWDSQKEQLWNYRAALDTSAKLLHCCSPIT